MTKATTLDTIHIPESEEQLVRTAEIAISGCRWTVGGCASKWTQRYAKGRTDGDFGALIGLSGDQVYQRRRVWETFADVYEQFEALKWSHFYAALNWDDAAECFQWAEETQSTVSEMKAWRRAMRGEDLTSEPEAGELASGSVSYLSAEPAFVQDPGSFGNGDSAGRGTSGRRADSADMQETATLTGVARGLPEEDYAPFRQGAMLPVKSDDGAATATAAEPTLTADMLAKRICSTLERCTKALSPDHAPDFSSLPDTLRQRLIAAGKALQSAIEELV